MPKFESREQWVISAHDLPGHHPHCPMAIMLGQETGSRENQKFTL